MQEVSVVKRAAFVSEDERVISELEEEFDIIVSDRNDLVEELESEVVNLEHDEEEILKLFEKEGVFMAVGLGYRRLFTGEFIEKCNAELFNVILLYFQSSKDWMFSRE